jgi:hypothetical protein
MKNAANDAAWRIIGSHLVSQEVAPKVITMGQTLKTARVRTQLETKLLDALQTKELVIALEELRGRNLVEVLREKLRSK